ncbi:hypothetical protein GCM10009558_090650 [Virgisporangium aurantiacum]
MVELRWITHPLTFHCQTVVVTFSAAAEAAATGAYPAFPRPPEPATGAAGSTPANSARTATSTILIRKADPSPVDGTCIRP